MKLLVARKYPPQPVGTYIGREEPDLDGVLCFALGELGGLAGLEERAQVEAGQLGNVGQLLCRTHEPPPKSFTCMKYPGVFIFRIVRTKNKAIDLFNTDPTNQNIIFQIRILI